jgi:hypothetical protein
MTCLRVGGVEPQPGWPLGGTGWASVLPFPAAKLMGRIGGPSIGDKLGQQERFESRREAKPDMIEDVQTGRLYPAEILPASAEDIRSIGPGWKFDWLTVVRQKEVFKIYTLEEPSTILGLMAIERHPGFIEINLLEVSPPHVGRRKRLKNIAGSLIAFAANLSFLLGYEGYVKLTSKTQLLGHYEKAYGFIRQGKSQNMYLNTSAAAAIIATFDGGVSDGNTP